MGAKWERNFEMSRVGSGLTGIETGELSIWAATNAPRWVTAPGARPDVGVLPPGRGQQPLGLIDPRAQALDEIGQSCDPNHRLTGP